MNLKIIYLNQIEPLNPLKVKLKLKEPENEINLKGFQDNSNSNKLTVQFMHVLQYQLHDISSHIEQFTYW